jgi:hypothetical protein
MTKFEMSVKFSVVMEKHLHDIEADSEFEALTEAWQTGEKIIEELVNQYGESVYMEEIIANPVGAPEDGTTM